MPYLGDFLGQIMSEVTIARVQADLEAVRVAEMYAGHPLLRHLPVPRVRLPDVHIDVPFVARGETEVARIFPKLTQYVKEFQALAIKYMKEELALQMTANRERTLKRQLAKSVAGFGQPEGLPVDQGAVLKTLLREMFDSLRPAELEVISRSELAKHRRVVASRARTTFNNLVEAPPRLEVGVTSKDLKDLDPSVVTRIQLSLSEDGLEWVSIETDDGTSERLVAE